VHLLSLPVWRILIFGYQEWTGFKVEATMAILTSVLLSRSLRRMEGGEFTWACNEYARMLLKFHR